MRGMDKYTTAKKASYVALALAFFLVPLLVDQVRNYAAGVAVVAGLVFTVLFGNPFAARTARMTSPMLGLAIVLMGFRLNLRTVLETGLRGLGYTVVGLALAMALGVAIGRKMRLERDTTLLISTGTAVCGGSAIAAVAPVLDAKPHSVAISTAVVFILNAVALILFPIIGHHFGFTQEQFGLWSAIAIHDTSSVVGATMQYGAKAMEVGVTVKLARTLWIVPLALAVSLAVPRGEGGKRARIRIPWFIPCFLLASAAVTLFPALGKVGGALGEVSKCLMVMTLFLIGSNVSVAKIKEMGVKPLLHGIWLWAVVLVVWFFAVKYEWVSVA